MGFFFAFYIVLDVCEELVIEAFCVREKFFYFSICGICCGTCESHFVSLFCGAPFETLFKLLAELVFGLLSLMIFFGKFSKRGIVLSETCAKISGVSYLFTMIASFPGTSVEVFSILSWSCRSSRCHDFIILFGI